MKEVKKVNCISAAFDALKTKIGGSTELSSWLAFVPDINFMRFLVVASKKVRLCSDR
jgi:hypothetical protein